MIHFKIIRWKNMLSTGNQFTEVKLDRSPNTLVIGINGAGKSTLLDALTFALFGKPFRNINKPKLVNTINDKDCLVEVEFRIGSREYKIERGIKPAVFNIYCNGVLQDQEAKSKDYQDYLETHILKFNYKAFTQIVILGASSFVPFMQLPAADRRAIIEELLDIKIFSSMNSIVKGRLTGLKMTSEEIKGNISSTLSKIEMQKKYVEDAKKNSADNIQVKTAEYTETEEQVNKLLVNANLVQQHIDVLLKQIADENPTNEKLRKLHQFETKIETKVKKLEKELKFFEENDQCPTCTQAIDKVFKENTINTANISFNECVTGLTKLDEERNKLNIRLNEIGSVQKKIHQHQSELTRISASVRVMQTHMQKIQTDINQLKTRKILSDDMLEISEKLVKDLEGLHERRKDLTDIRQYFDVAATLLKDSGIKTKIIKQYLPVINKLVNKYLAAMDFFVAFEIDEEFNETIKSRHRDAFKYDNFSEGEKMRIDLALLFAWRSVAKLKNSMNTNLLILDEVFDSSLDSSGTEEFMKLLQTLGNESNVFVISHKGDILVDKFRSVIRFEKIQNFSRIAP